MVDKMINIKSPELLAPAGNPDCLKTAVDFGADAVYIGGELFTMRTSPDNFSFEELCKGIEYAHNAGVRVYLTCNTLPRNNEINRLPAFFEQAAACRADALIISDIGVLTMAATALSDVELHVSTQLGVVNHLTASALYNMGASRVVTARELSLEEISEIRAKAPKELEIEAFVHGSMCVSYSGRCLLSNYMTGRDANRGDCAQPCRWKYALMEETRPGQYFPVIEDESGTHILNSKDLCMAEHIADLYNAGISSFKIEGRAKAEYYVALTTNAYRYAIDSFISGEEKPEQWIIDELYKISHREYCTGFYYENPSQVYSNGGYIRDYQVVGIVRGYDDGCIIVSQRNKFLKGDSLEILEPKSKPFKINCDKMYDDNSSEIESAPHAMMTVKIPCETEVKSGSFVRKPTQVIPNQKASYRPLV